MKRERLKTIMLPFMEELIELIPTEGGTVIVGGNARKIVGLFSTEEDARSPHADMVAWGTVGWTDLTPEQRRSPQIIQKVCKHYSTILSYPHESMNR